jgi:hypothetical protein
LSLFQKAAKSISCRQISVLPSALGFNKNTATASANLRHDKQRDPNNHHKPERTIWAQKDPSISAAMEKTNSNTVNRSQSPGGVGFRDGEKTNDEAAARVYVSGGSLHS